MLAVLAAVWAACVAAGYLYAQQYGIPWTVFWAVIPAFLLETAFYVVLGVERWRGRVERWPMLPFWMTLAAVTPYCAASVALGSFGWPSFLLLAALAAAASFWYARLPKRPAVDILFLVFLALVVLVKLFQKIYVDPHPKVPLEVLGQLMWVRTGAFALLSVRRVTGVGFGFVPTRKDWGVGILYYLAFLPVGAALAWRMGFLRVHGPQVLGWKTLLVVAGTFLGVLWVLALGEEFFFRGLLQQWLAQWLSSDAAGLVWASVLFGSTHLFFRTFPNWRMALLATAAGVCYGLAFRHARSIRASMVTHALVVTTWRVFLA